MSKLLDPAPQPTPIVQSDPHRGVAPTAYVWRMRQQHCQRCGYFFESLDGLFAETWLRPTTAEGGPYGKPFRNFRPLGNEPPIYNLPVRTERTPVQKLPFCSECSRDALAHLPTPALEGRVVGLFNSGFAQSLIARSGGKPSVAKPKRPAGASIDAIAKDLGL